jgi:hypothetical protein
MAEMRPFSRRLQEIRRQRVIALTPPLSARHAAERAERERAERDRQVGGADGERHGDQEHEAM